ncbi:MAG TPA: bifunctional glycosyltransferase family 2/GtrA family protein [Candidatus Limnocylindria bacterium]|nr:bifunctional glycosyltransferase family 2/GtrA family protein [Candidatus Limnocylindria bacterium]
MAVPQDAVILIPSYHPDEKLGQYARDLIQAGFRRIVIVDDGSGPDYEGQFAPLRGVEGITLLQYPVNGGKGHALKHGLRHILEAFPQAPGVVTADSDGQHTAADCTRVAGAMLEHPDKLVLGSRDFNSPDVPPKSKTGNRLTSFFFALLYGQWLPDTQTGLRGMAMSEVPRLAGVAGDRYEYEMNVLIHWAGWKRGFETVPIRTIYEDRNKGSHFRPLQDSARIYKLLFGNFARFASSSALSALVDVGLFTALDKWVFPVAVPGLFSSRYGAVLAATAVARVASSLFNFHLNRQFVFQFTRGSGALLRYLVLAAGVLLTSATLVDAVNRLTGMDRTAAKIIIDLLLFFVSYRLQRTWVFPPEPKRSAQT